jgi:hypothetical protein
VQELLHPMVKKKSKNPTKKILQPKNSNKTKKKTKNSKTIIPIKEKLSDTPSDRTQNGRPRRPKGENAILVALQESETALSIEQIIKKTKMSLAQVYVWICGEGKQISSIKKVGIGLYKYEELPTAKKNKKEPSPIKNQK